MCVNLLLYFSFVVYHRFQKRNTQIQQLTKHNFHSRRDLKSAIAVALFAIVSVVFPMFCWSLLFSSSSLDIWQPIHSLCVARYFTMQSMSFSQTQTNKGTFFFYCVVFVGVVVVFGVGFAQRIFFFHQIWTDSIQRNKNDNQG